MQNLLYESKLVFTESIKFYEKHFDANPFFEMCVGHAMFICLNSIKLKEGIHNGPKPNIINVDNVLSIEERLSAYIENMKTFCIHWVDNDRDLEQCLYWLAYCYGWVDVSLRPHEYAVITDSKLHHEN